MSYIKIKRSLKKWPLLLYIGILSIIIHGATKMVGGWPILTKGGFTSIERRAFYVYTRRICGINRTINYSI